MAKTGRKGIAFAFPGQEGSTFIDLPAGEYLMACFIPVGLTPESLQSGEEPSGPPHVTQGMKLEATVS